MTEARKIASDVAFTPNVKAIQSRKGSGGVYARMETGDGWTTTICTDRQRDARRRQGAGRAGHAV